MKFEALQQKDIAAAFGTTARTIRTWTAKGMPRNSDGTYSLPSCIEWSIIESQGGPAPKGNEADDTWLQLYRSERYKIAKIERKKLKGDLMPKDEISQQWALRLAHAKSTFMNFTDRLPPLLVGKTRENIRETLKAEIRELLTNYCKPGPNCEP